VRHLVGEFVLALSFNSALRMEARKMLSLIVVALATLSLLSIVVSYSACVLGKKADYLSEQACYREYAEYLDQHPELFGKQGIPTDEMLNDMAMEYDYDMEEHRLYMDQYYHFYLKTVCPNCGDGLLHRIDQWSYISLTSLDTAVQDVTTEEDGVTHSMVIISKFCGMDCIERATQGCTFDIEWYPCRDPQARYVCDTHHCNNTQCIASDEYLPDLLRCKRADLCAVCSLTTCIHHPRDYEELPCSACKLHSAACARSCEAVW
jgi:hypothetical protein